MSDVAIRVENLSKLYHIGSKKSGSLRESMMGMFKSKEGFSSEFWALKDVSFEIKKGEAVGIIGRNGAGKSTLLKILSRITEPTKGCIDIYGRVSSLLEVGTGFHPELTGRENIFLNGTILGMTRREVKSKFDEIVDFSGIEKFLDTPVKHYSSGMYVRLAFAVAAHLEPEILIIDEVLAVGDAEFQKKCLGKMNEVSKNEGRTVLFVSHNMGAVKQLCDKAIILENGLLQSLGESDKIISTYISTNYKPHFNYEGPEISTKKIWFKNIYLTNKGGVRSFEFFHDESITVNFKIGYNLNKHCHDYTIFCIILDSAKNRIFAAESKIINNEEIKLNIEENFLVRGNYSIYTFIHKTRTEQIDAVEDVCSFNVIDKGSFLNIQGEYDYGKVFGKVQWFYC